jgi:hypothetical protein
MFVRKLYESSTTSNTQDTAKDPRTFRDIPSSARYMLGVEAISSFFILALYR